MRARTLALREVDRPLALEAMRLWSLVWPKAKRADLEAGADAFLARAADGVSAESVSGQLHFVKRDDAVVALSQSFLREIRFEETEERRTVLALAGVCAHPDFRGEGLGVEVVKAAFARLAKESIELSLFQTGVPDFYRKLGSRVVENRFFNSLADGDPEANPWWDEQVMIHPAAARWPEGRVDLRGPGY